MKTTSDSTEVGEGTSPVVPTTLEATVGEPPKSLKRQIFSSLVDFLRVAYSGSSIRLNPGKREIAAMRSAPRLTASERDELLALAASDRTLSRTRELMLASMERLDAPILREQLLDFVREVLRRHPAFSPNAVGGLLENRPGSPVDGEAIRVLATQAWSNLAWPAGQEPLKKAEAEQGRLNSVRCLVLWLTRSQGTGLDHVLCLLQVSIWNPAARKFRTDQQRLRVLIAARDAAAAGVACSLLERKLEEQTDFLASTRHAAERAAIREKKLEDDLAAEEEKLLAAEAKVKRLEEDIGTLQRRHQDELVHMRDAYEQLRGRMLRRLKEELVLLDEGLHALRRDPPKLHIIEDHAERAIEGLKGEMERLRGQE